MILLNSTKHVFITSIQRKVDSKRLINEFYRMYKNWVVALVHADLMTECVGNDVNRITWIRSRSELSVR